VNRNQSRLAVRILVAWILLASLLGAAPTDTKRSTPEIPRIWDHAAMVALEVPLAVTRSG
jgi:hypothetical protein